MKNIPAIAIVFLMICSTIFAQGADSSVTAPKEKLVPSEARRQLQSTLMNKEQEITGIKTLFAPDSGGAYSPKKALLFSAITPGLGHVYVRKPFKGLIYFTAEAYHLQRAWHFNNLAGYVEDTKAMVGKENWLSLTKAEKNQAIIDSTGQDIGMNYWRPKEKRNKRIWWSAGIYVMAMLDAYVDAHLSDFPEGDMEFINNREIRSRGIKFSFNINRRKND